MTHRIRPSWQVQRAVALAFAFLAACNRTSANRNVDLSLRHDLRTACDSGLRYPYFLDLRIGGSYVVNGERMDSSRLAHWLGERVPTYPMPMRRLVIYNDSTRRTELSWIVGIADQAGVKVYEFMAADSLCYPAIP